MSVRVLPDFLINQIAAGEVVECGASVVKELVENALDAGADQIVIDVVDGGRTLINIVDNGCGMSKQDLATAIKRHATSKLPDDDLLNISYMGFRGEALPSIASVSDMTIDTCSDMDSNGWHLDCSTGEIKPSDWQKGTRIRVENLFAKTPARLKFLRSDRAEMMAVLDVVKRLAMARTDVGFVLNNKWFFPKNQPLLDRLSAVMGDDVRGKMLQVSAESGSSDLTLRGYVSEPTFHRASSVDQYLFINGRPVKDKVLVAALRAAYMDVMHAREFPLCALYLSLNPRTVDVNVSPAKTEVHFLEPTHVRAFIIKSLRDVLSKTMVDNFSVSSQENNSYVSANTKLEFDIRPDMFRVCQPNKNEDFMLNKIRQNVVQFDEKKQNVVFTDEQDKSCNDSILGQVIGQFYNKYIISVSGDKLIIIDQHAAHERITYEKLRLHSIKVQPLLTPIIVNMRSEDVVAVLKIQDLLKESGLVLDAFGDDAVAIFEKTADWDLDWKNLLHDIADEVRDTGFSSKLNERLHLKLANYACHHSVRAGQKLGLDQMNALLRDIERTQHGAECNHGRPVYKVFSIADLDTMFERG